MDLNDLLVSFDDLDDDEAEERGIELYHELYLNKGRVGVLLTQDGQEVVFHEDRFDHAFRTSPDRGRFQYSKKIIARDRLERIRWIGAIIRGEVENVEYWSIPSESRNRRKRLYIVWNFRYVIWLEPRKDDGWKFSSAYSPGAQDIRRYTRLPSARKIWPPPKI